MLPAVIRCVVGIDVATHTHVVGALDAPSGTVRPQPSPIDATAEGYARLCSWLQTWGAAEEVRMGMEATGPLWDPLDAYLSQAG
jgi:hypothetical protein